MQYKFLRLFSLLFILVLVACQVAPTEVPETAAPPTEMPVPATATAVPPTPTEASPVLELVLPDGSSQMLTMEDLKALPQTEGKGGIKSSTGQITLPAQFKGISLKDIVEQTNIFDESMGISVVAQDGYAITFSYDQVMNGTFTSYDPGSGDELKSPVPLTAALAYEIEEKPLDIDKDGLLRVVILSDEPKQVTDGHWSVKWVTKIEIKTLGQEWILELEGAINESMDRSTFESGAAPNCHGATWKDDKAQDWVGIPLWLLVGRVDDDIKHEGPAFNDAAVQAGYAVDVVASDGYTVSFESARIAHNNNIIVAYLVNGNPLPDKHFPLRLVGSDLQKNEMVGMIAKIVVHLEPMPEVTATEAVVTEAVVLDTSDADLVLSGMVENQLVFKESDLRELEVVQITAEHPKKGQQEYEGVRLSVLLDMAKAKPDAKKLVLTASDGFTAEVFLAEVQSCADCLVAFTDEAGVFNMVMPGLPSNVWIKDIVKIEIL